MFEKVACRTALGMVVTIILGGGIKFALAHPLATGVLFGWLVVSAIVGYVIDKMTLKD